MDGYFLGVPIIGWMIVICPSLWGSFLWWLIRRLSREKTEKI